MPDLIIKPTATSGNKLILKDQAGGAVLTTADSGATLGTISGGTLTSGVTGGSGLDALPNTSSISKWTITAHTSSGSVDPVVGFSGTTINGSSIPTQSSGIFTFPSTGFWEINGAYSFSIATSTAISAENINLKIYLSTDSGSNYTTVGGGQSNAYYPADDWFRSQVHFQTILDITNVSTHRLKFVAYSVPSLYQYMNGDQSGQIIMRKLGET